VTGKITDQYFKTIKRVKRHIFTQNFNISNNVLCSFQLSYKLNILFIYNQCETESFILKTRHIESYNKVDSFTHHKIKTNQNLSIFNFSPNPQRNISKFMRWNMFPITPVCSKFILSLSNNCANLKLPLA
jgi:hypothetical protein